MVKKGCANGAMYSSKVERLVNSAGSLKVQYYILDIGVRLENAGDTTEQLNRSNREVGVEKQAESEIDFQIHRVVPEERQTA